MKPSAVLKKAMKLIEDPKKWGKGFRGDNRPETSSCALEALSTADPSAYGGPIYGYLETAFSSYKVSEVNDAPDTTHADVLTAYCFAIELVKDAEKEGS